MSSPIVALAVVHECDRAQVIRVLELDLTGLLAMARILEELLDVLSVELAAAIYVSVALSNETSIPMFGCNWCHTESVTIIDDFVDVTIRACQHKLLLVKWNGSALHR